MVKPKIVVSRRGPKLVVYGLTIQGKEVFGITRGVSRLWSLGSVSGSCERTRGFKGCVLVTVVRVSKV